MSVPASTGRPASRPDSVRRLLFGVVVLVTVVVIAACTPVDAAKLVPQAVIQVPGSYTVTIPSGSTRGPVGTIVVCTDARTILNFRTSILSQGTLLWNSFDGTASPVMSIESDLMPGPGEGIAQSAILKPGCGTLHIAAFDDGGPPYSGPPTMTVSITKCGPAMAPAPAGSLFAWGVNGQGELGLGDRVDRCTATRVGTSTGWSSVSAASIQTAAVRADGTLWEWGGFGADAPTTPTQIGTATDWVAVSASDTFSIARKADGTLWTWGANSSGQLGLGDTTSRATPTQVGADGDWASVSAGYAHAVAVKTDGTLWVWGNNSQADLGLGDTTNRTVPTQVGTATDWESGSAGTNHTIALKTDGSLWAWGSNADAQLGVGDRTDRNVPTQVGTATNWRSVDAGSFHNLGIRTDGTLWAWGDNVSGDLGLGDSDLHLDPEQVGTASDWRSVSAGNDVSVGVRGAGDVWEWGYNAAPGVLGQLDTIDRLTPTRVPVGSGWRGVSTSGLDTLAVHG